MADRIKLVKDDTRPQLIFSITDEVTGVPVDLSNAGTSLAVKFRAVGSTTIKATMTCGKLTGKVLDDGTIDYASPYNVAGVGGRAYMDWSSDALDTVGDFEAEIEITFNDGTVQTIYELMKFRVRADF